MTSRLPRLYDVFLSHAHTEAATVELLGARLTDEAGLKVWLDRWILIPGDRWQQNVTRGLDQAKTCAICIGTQTPSGWFLEETEQAIDRQVREPKFRVIPVVLPGGDRGLVNRVLGLRTWVDFSKSVDDGAAFHMLVSGIRGVRPGRHQGASSGQIEEVSAIRDKLATLRDLRADGLIDNDIALKYQRRLLDEFVRGERRSE